LTVSRLAVLYFQSCAKGSKMVHYNKRLSESEDQTFAVINLTVWLICLEQKHSSTTQRRSSMSMITLLQKLFLGTDKIAFIGADAIPAPVSRSYKSFF